MVIEYIYKLEWLAKGFPLPLDFIMCLIFPFYINQANSHNFWTYEHMSSQYQWYHNCVCEEAGRTVFVTLMGYW